MYDMGNRIKEWRNKMGITAQELADMVNSSQGQISKLERGERRLDTDWMDRISKALNCRPIDLILNEEAKIPIIGSLGLNAEITLYKEGDKRLEETVECPPDNDPKTTGAVKIKGEFLEPSASDNWILYYSKKQTAMSDKLLNKLCVVKVKNGPILYRRVQKGYKKGKYNLLIHNAKMIEDADLEWAVPLLFFRTDFDN